MDESKELKHIKKLENPMPKVRYEDVPEERREKLKFTHGFKGTESPEWFEEWLAVYLKTWYGYPQKKLSKPMQEEMMHQAYYHRAEFNHIRDFRRWRVDNLDPLIKDLAKMARHDPQYDWQYLYALERQKILCMARYFSHSRMADANGNYGSKMWIDICLELLHYIEDNGKNIPYKKIKQMNIRNVKGLVPQRDIDYYLQAPEPSENNESGLDKEFYGQIIYVRKMERLYHMIRLFKTRDWWE